MKDKTKKSICEFCGKEITLVGQGRWREDIQECEWYTTDHKCSKGKKQLNEMAKQLGTLGGLATKSKYGVKHYSEAGKKGMKARWGK